MHNILFILYSAALLSIGSAFAGVYDDVLSAAENNRTEEVISLLRRGLDVNTADRDGSTLLVIAARTGNLELTEFLTANRANLRKANRFGDTALHLAVSQGHLPIVQRLVASGAELNPTGWTPLHYAVLAGNHPSSMKIAKLLLKSGADPEARAPNGRTALMLAAQAGKREFAKLLLEAGANISAQDYSGLTAEAIARQKQFNDVAELLTVKQSFSIEIE